MKSGGNSNRCDEVELLADARVFNKVLSDTRLRSSPAGYEQHNAIVGNPPPSSLIGVYNEFNEDNGIAAGCERSLYRVLWPPCRGITNCVIVREVRVHQSIPLFDLEGSGSV